MPMYVGAVDQGTTSTRFMVFDRGGREIARHQLEHEQIMTQPGWVEHDPLEISERTNTVVAGALRHAGLTAADLAAIGITNQRETTVVWNPKTGRPWYNAIVWQDTRTDRIVSALEAKRKLLYERTGLPPATYFSGTKLQWILDNVEGVRAAAERGEAVFGNVDSWVIWHLTGGADGGVHVTDVTNASRTLLMDLRTLDWDDELLALFGVFLIAAPGGGESLVAGAATAPTVLDAVRACGVPRHPDQERPVVAVVGRPPLLRRRHHRDQVLLQRLEVECLELFCVVEGLAHRIGQGRVLVENRQVQLIRPPVPVRPAAVRLARERALLFVVHRA